MTENGFSPPQATPFQWQWLSVWGLSPCLSLLFKMLCRPTDSKDNRLIVTPDPSLHSDSEQRFEIVFRETYHGLFQFLLHASILAYCKKFFNMLHSAQYLEN